MHLNCRRRDFLSFGFVRDNNGMQRKRKAEALLEIGQVPWGNATSLQVTQLSTSFYGAGCVQDND